MAIAYKNSTFILISSFLYNKMTLYKQATMKGIQYLVDDTGKKTAVVIDLQQWGELWEDFQDILVSRSRADEPEVSWDDLQVEMDRENWMSERVSN